MKESYIEGVAIHDDPESCTGAREVAGEALTGAHAGRVWSREIVLNRGADAVAKVGRQHDEHRQREVFVDPARSETPRTHGISLRENREVSTSPERDGCSGRTGKARSREPVMHDVEKSDESVVPTKQPNEACGRRRRWREGTRPRGTREGDT